MTPFVRLLQVKYVGLIALLLISFVGRAQIFCTVVDSSNGFSETFGSIDVNTGAVTNLSNTVLGNGVLLGSQPIIDPVNGYYLFLGIQSTLLSWNREVKVVDINTNQVINTFSYSSDYFPRHFAYNCFDSTIYCMIVDSNGGYSESFGTFDPNTGNITPLTGPIVLGSYNSGSTPVIDQFNQWYIYSTYKSSNQWQVIVIDIAAAQVINTFTYQNTNYPRSLSYSCQDSALYCVISSAFGGAFSNYLGEFDPLTGTVTQLSSAPLGATQNNGFSPIIDPVTNRLIYYNLLSTTFAWQVKTVEVPSGTIVNTFNYPFGLRPRYFASANNCGYTSFRTTKRCAGDSTRFEVYAKPVDSIRWDFGDPTTGINNTSTLFKPVHLFSDSGTFHVQLITYRSGIPDTISRSIFIEYNFPVDLGPDTAICEGTPLTLNATLQNRNYLWSDGSTNNTLSVDQAGQYWVERRTFNCATSDTINITVKAQPTVSLGPDTGICRGDTIVLNPVTTGTGFLWPDGSTDSSFQVTSNGVYAVTVSDNGCTRRDNILITLLQPEPGTLGADTLLCFGDSITLGPWDAGTDYVWQDSSTDSTFEVSNAGTYSVSLLSNGCKVFDTVAISYKPKPEPVLGADTSLCEGNTLEVTLPQNLEPISWQDGSSRADYTISREGTYWVNGILDQCTVSDTLKVELTPFPTIGLPNFTSLCEGDTLELTVSVGTDSVVWQDGSTDSVFQVTQAGTYAVSRYSDCGVKSDLMTVNARNCRCPIYFPTSFTPNNDGRNDGFAPESRCDFLAYDFKIYNRWGQVIFSTNDPTETWDGTFRSEEYLPGIYPYKLTYSIPGEPARTEVRTVQLLR